MSFKLSLILLFAMQFLSVGVLGQEVVRLHLDKTTRTGPGQGIFCDKAYNCGLLPSEDRKQTTFGNDGMPINIKREGKDFLITVDSNGRLGLSDEKAVRLSKDASSVVKIKKTSLRDSLSISLTR